MHICVYVHVYMCKYVYVCTYVYMCIYVYIYVCMYVYMCVYVYMCIYMYMYACIYLCAYMKEYIYHGVYSCAMCVQMCAYEYVEARGVCHTLPSYFEAWSLCEMEASVFLARLAASKPHESSCFYPISAEVTCMHWTTPTLLHGC
jgi:nuclear pore complex protein Nup62